MSTEKKGFDILYELKRILQWFYVAIATLPRDLKAGIGYVKIIIWIKYSYYRNLTIHKQFDKVAKRYPHRRLFISENERWTFLDVQERSHQVANYFLTQGLEKGDSVALFMENRPEYITIWLGLSRIGIITALINTNLRGKSLDHCMKAANCRAIIYGNELKDAVKEVDADGSIDGFQKYVLGAKDMVTEVSTVDLTKTLDNTSIEPPKTNIRVNFFDKMLYIYTSGTTGLPKAAIIKQSRLMFIISATQYLHGIKETDTVYTPLPLYHTAGGIVTAGMGLMGGVSIAFRKKFSASQFWSDCVKYEVTVFQYIGEICRFILSQPPKREDTRHQIRLIYGNGLRPDIWKEFVTRFNIPVVSEFYGSTEGNCNTYNQDNTIGAVGFFPVTLRPFLPFYLIKVDREGNVLRDPETGLTLICGVNEPGELVGIIKNGNPIAEFDGYTDKASHKKKVVEDVVRKGDRAFRSGDILRSDQFGYLFFMDRHGDTFRWRGENVSTAEVEAAVSRGIGLGDAAVYGVQLPGTDGRAGMASFVDPNENVDIESLRIYLNKELPAYARPLFLRLLKEMPLTGTFKIKKTDLQIAGYNLDIVQDKIYFLQNGKYIPLHRELYEKIMAGEIKV